MSFEDSQARLARAADLAQEQIEEKLAECRALEARRQEIFELMRENALAWTRSGG